jgi:hypothetical protein
MSLRPRALPAGFIAPVPAFPSPTAAFRRAVATRDQARRLPGNRSVRTASEGGCITGRVMTCVPVRQLRIMSYSQAGPKHLQQCAESQTLRNSSLGPLAVTELPVSLAWGRAATGCPAVQATAPLLRRRGGQLDQFEAARHQEPAVIGNDAHARPAGGLQGLRVLGNTGHLGLQLRGQAQAHD